MKQTRADDRRLSPPARRALRRAWLALLLLAGGAPEAEAQAGAAEIAVVRAALPALRASLPPGTAALDPEPFCEARLIGWDCPGDFRAAAEAHGFRLSGSTFTLVCVGGPASCRLVGAESLVKLSAPRISRREATLEATVWTRAGSGQRPVERRRARLTLARGPDGWEVVGEEALPPG